jgi:hypothetical protein
VVLARELEKLWRRRTPPLAHARRSVQNPR